jgi:hypothetical protein
MVPLVFGMVYYMRLFLPNIRYYVVKRVEINQAFTFIV